MRAQNDMIMRSERQSMAPYQPMMPQQAAMAPEVPESSILGGIWRHFWLVILFGVIGAGAALAYLKYATPMYTSVSTIYIKPTSNLRVLNETLSSAQRSNYLYTQATLITSTPILTMVAAKPEIKDLRSWELSKGNPILYMREALIADVGRKDDVISVSIDSPYPQDAEKIVNAVVNAYIAYQGMDKQTSSSGVLKTLRDKLADAKTEQTRLGALVLDFQKKHPNWNFDGLYQDEMRAISHSYMQARIATIEARAAYLPGNPVLQKALAKEEELYTAYQEKLSQAMKSNITMADYQKMDSDLKTQTAFVTLLDSRIRDLELTKTADQIVNEVEVYEKAQIAERPSSPRKKSTLVGAIFIGLLLGAGLALVRDKTDGRMRSVEEIQTVIGLPILGVVPSMSGRRTAIARAMTVHLDPRSAVAEAYRTIRTAVYFGTSGETCKTILVTSPEPGDGKTTSASNLAIAIAQTGRTVLLLDADFRKPSQHKNLDIKNTVGLSSVLAGHETLERAIQRTGVEGLDILPCGPIPANPSEILNSREFGELIDTLAARYDHILFDSPPVNPVTDARILGAVCDATILVLRADKSTRKAGEHARNALLGVSARVLGAIVNDAPHKKGYDVYGGGYYGHADPVRHPDGYGSGQKMLRRLPTAV